MACTTFVVVVLVASVLGCTIALPLENSPTFVELDKPANLSRIVGGFTASDGQFPYVASLRHALNNTHFCAGIIINALYVLTAAHCTVGKYEGDVMVVVGTTTLNSGGSHLSLSLITIHEEYDPVTRRNDISVLRLLMPITSTDNAAPIALDSTQLGAGYAVTVIGWGSTSDGDVLSNDLRYLHSVTINYRDCAALLSPNELFGSNLCTLTREGEGVCHGDSGGPLVHDGTLAGIVSWAVPCAQGYPDVFLRTSDYRTWILDHIW